MKKTNKMNNKGFSLIELIIVIAIMVILAGALAPAVIKQVAKSRRSHDVNNGQSIASAISTTLGDETAAADAPTAKVTLAYSKSSKTVTDSAASTNKDWTKALNDNLQGGYKAICATRTTKTNGGTKFAAAGYAYQLGSNEKATVWVTDGKKELEVFPDVDEDMK